MKTVFVNGTFDLLHRAHLEMLSFAKSLGDTLIVAIDCDHRVKCLKGLDRPVIKQDDRKYALRQLKSVDAVFIFETDFELETIIKTYEPDIMVKGSDYIGKPIIGSQYCKSIVFFNRINEYSTTKTIESISDRR